MRANDNGAPRGSCRSQLEAPATIALFLVAMCVMATSCTGPARSTSTYESKAANTAEEVVSASRTVMLAAQIGDERRSFASTVSVTIADAEDDAQTARDAFASIQPPDATSDDIRSTVLPTVERACSVIAEVRIAARRADGDLSEVASPLTGLADQLDGLAQRYG
jgi:hypothetical protein